MLEINEHYRLVKHTGHGENCWIAEELSSTESSYKRAIWKPVTRLLTHAQAEYWLTITDAPAGAIERFKEVAGGIQ